MNGEIELDQDELQPADPIEQTEEVGEIAETVEGVETPAAQATAEEGKKVQFNEEQQRLLDRKIGEQVAKKRKAEREADDLRKRLEALETPRTAAIVVPDLPDPYTVSDSEFNRLRLERDEALKKSVIVDQQNAQLQAQQNALRQEQAKLEHEALVEKTKTYAQRAPALGVTEQELLSAGQALAEFGISQTMADLILEDDEGPLITKYLAQNLKELDDLIRLSPERAVAKLVTQIKRDAAVLKPKNTKAPDPIDGVSSGAAIAPRSGRSKIIDIY